MQTGSPSRTKAKPRTGKSLRDDGSIVDSTLVYSFGTCRCTSYGGMMALPMSLLTAEQRSLLESVSPLGYANPFLPERVELERAVLGAEFLEGEPVWSYRAEHPEPRANVWRIVAKVEPLVEPPARPACSGGAAAAGARSGALRRRRACSFSTSAFIPSSYEAGFGAQQANPARWRFYNEFLADWRRYFALAEVTLPQRARRRATPSPVSGRSSAPSISPSATSSAARCRRRGCAERYGNPSSPTTCGATGGPCTRAWASSRP